VKELIEKLIGALPFFAQRFMALIGGPKRTVLALDLESDSALEEAFTFLAVSFGVAFLAQIPLLADMQGVFGKVDKTTLFASLAVLSALAFVLNVVLLAVVWKIVGATPAWKKIVAISCYFCGVSTILFLLCLLLGTGVFKMMNPVEYKDFWNGVDTPDPEDSMGFKLFAGFSLLGLVGSCVWIVCVWGAYRELMKVSKGKSAMALILFTTLSPLLLFAQYALVGNLMQPNQSPAMPSDLAGQWVLEQCPDSSGANSTHSVIYTFTAPESRSDPLGFYKLSDTGTSVEGECLITVTKLESGTAEVHDPTIDLTPVRRTESRADQCTGRTSEVHPQLGVSQYRYKINKDASGWTLRLNNRFGDTCLTPKKQ
jgi:hypothetical protein